MSRGMRYGILDSTAKGSRGPHCHKQRHHLHKQTLAYTLVVKQKYVKVGRRYVNGVYGMERQNGTDLINAGVLNLRQFRK